MAIDLTTFFLAPRTLRRSAIVRRCTNEVQPRRGAHRCSEAGRRRSQRNFGIEIGPAKSPRGIFPPMTSKTRRNFALTYLVFCIVAIAIERHGLERSPMCAIENILAAPILWGLAGYGL